MFFLKVFLHLMHFPICFLSFSLLSYLGFNLVVGCSFFLLATCCAFGRLALGEGCNAESLDLKAFSD